MDLEDVVRYLDTVKEEGCEAIQNVNVTTPNELRMVSFRELAAAFSRHAREHYQFHRYREALFWYTREVKVLGIWLQMPESDRVKQARIDSLRDRARIESLLAEAYYNRGNTYDELQEYDKAIKDYHCALALNNLQPWDVLHNRGLVYEKLGQLDKAEQDVLQAHQRAPGRLPNIERSLARIQSKRHGKKALPWWKHSNDELET